jgi:uncharacterized membrane protein required for colicin V production
MEPISLLDGLVLALFLLTTARGLAIGLIREGFSIAALAGACIAVATFRVPAAQWLLATFDPAVPESIAPWIAGAAIFVIMIAVVGRSGRFVRRGVRAVRGGWADRVAGGVLGAAEGFLLAMLVVVGALWLLGRDSQAVSNSISVQVYDRARALFLEQEDNIRAVPAAISFGPPANDRRHG